MKITTEHDTIGVVGDDFKITVDIKDDRSRTRFRLIVYAEAERKSEAIEKNITSIDEAIEQLNEAKEKLGEM